MHDHADLEWSLPLAADGTVTLDQVKIALLMDIRRSLAPLRCTSFQAIPGYLRAIERAIRSAKRVPRTTQQQRIKENTRRHRQALRRAAEVKRAERP